MSLILVLSQEVKSYQKAFVRDLACAQLPSSVFPQVSLCDCLCVCLCVCVCLSECVSSGGAASHSPELILW